MSSNYGIKIDTDLPDKINTFSSGSKDYASFIYTTEGSASFKTETDITCDFLIVGGGGSGGVNLQGAGGGGALGYFSGFKVSAGTYDVIVGRGGAQAEAGSHTLPGLNGSGSAVFGETAGGGEGASVDGNKIAGDGGTISVQAASSQYDAVVTSGAHTGGTASGNAGASGAGAGANGGNMSGNSSVASPSPAGGVGKQIGTIYDGINNYYWAGGGGGEGYADGGGAGGLGGGGGGAAFSEYTQHSASGAGGGSALNSGIDGGHANDVHNGGKAGDNTGGGGGGGSNVGGGQTSAIGGAGGSGIVIIKVGG